ncbi:hypothetical protein C4565_02525 [Candidatus Parcubacteria bacterium]|jgi:hypothetical protein|nr:MAG: hypothetical protein C4565_02525 [Candidatus Parcubacteria bacterium]
MKSEPISFEKGDRVLILPTPYNEAKKKLGETKNLELNKEYIVASAYRVWDKWHVRVYLDPEQKQISEDISGKFFAKK